MKDHLAQVFAAVGIVAALLGGLSWRLQPIESALADIRDDVHDLQRRVSHLETSVEVILERLPPVGGRISPAVVPAATPGGGGYSAAKREGEGAGAQAAAPSAPPAALLPDSSCPRDGGA